MCAIELKEQPAVADLSGRLAINVGRKLVWVIAGTAWFAGVTAGLAWLANYANRPGIAAEAPQQWPAASAITRDSHRPTLVMLAHPQCDCTRASLAELAELIARARQRPKTVVVFIRPPGVAEHWEETALWRAASRVPDTTVVRDEEGREARNFRSQTSGQTLLYGANGRLLFSGGTTIARGHLGDNEGLFALLQILDGKTAGRSQTPVYGCSLFADAATVRSQQVSRR
jgi:hypothetical protein